MNMRKPILRTVAFAVVLLLAICAVQGPFGVDSDENFQRVRGFYSERKGSLDGVYIGASNVHEFWQPAVGWMERGIAVYNFSTSALPMQGVKYMVREARKTQPDALYIFNLNNFKAQKVRASIANLHRAVDYMPLSANKIGFINATAEKAGLSWKDRLELLFPVIRFHSRWSTLQSWAYGNWDEQYKYFQLTDRFQHKSVDISDKYITYDGRSELDGEVVRVFTDLLDYLDREHVSALFIKVPQVMKKQAIGRMNALEDMVKQRGYPCLDLLDRIGEMGLDLHRDYFDKGHTNIHGSWKISKYIADYLAERYHFSDKRSQADYALWDRSAETFDAVVDACLLPFERDVAPRADLAAPVVAQPKVGGQGVRLTWSASAGAEGYEIYRKRETEDGGQWRLLAEVDGDTTAFADRDIENDAKYSYCVAAFLNRDGRRAYGDCDVNGVAVSTPGKDGASGDDSAAGGDQA